MRAAETDCEPELRSIHHNKTEFLSLIEENKEDLFAFLSELIKIDSQNFGLQGREEAIALYLKKAFEEIGIAAEAYSPLDVDGLTSNADYNPGRNLENRLNADALLPGGKHDRKLLLAAHDDTVPVGDVHTWSFDPFGGEIRDGKISGRGACDDKYGIAVAWFLMKLCKENQIALPYDLVFTAYCDEEFGGGNGALAACLKHRPDDILNLDCDNLEIWSAGVGGGELEGTLQSLIPLDSCEKLLDGLMIVREELKVFRTSLQQKLQKKELFAGTNIPDTCLRFLEVNAGGSLSLNGCKVRFIFYTCENEEETKAELKVLNDAINMRLTPLQLAFSGFVPATRFFRYVEGDPVNPAAGLLMDAIQLVTENNILPQGACLSDLSLMLTHGSRRALSYGAGRKFDEAGGAHQPDEFIACDDLLACAKITGAFLLSYAER